VQSRYHQVCFVRDESAAHTKLENGHTHTHKDMNMCPCVGLSLHSPCKMPPGSRLEWSSWWETDARGRGGGDGGEVVWCTSSTQTTADRLAEERKFRANRPLKAGRSFLPAQK